MQVKCPECGHIHYVDSGRTRNQSALLHKLIHAFSDASGIPFDRAKMRLKFEHGLWIDIPLQPEKLKEFMTRPPWAGAYLDVGNRLVYVKSESELAKKEEAEFIDYVVSRCIEADADIDFMEAM